jgi:murein DD-endopeptidase MepM/ murein hydrolase activator NlpD
MKFLFYAVSPYWVNQGFGSNPEYYARFKDQFGNPEKGHNGIDFMASHGQPLYSPCDGMAMYAEDEHGGDGIYIDTTDGTNWYRVILWHLCSKNDPQFKPLIPTTGTHVPVKAGQLIGYTDNSGAPFESSGDHLHFGFIPISKQYGNALYPSNGFNGCVDATPYFTGFYATEVEKYQQLQVTLISTLTQLVALLKRKIGL